MHKQAKPRDECLTMNTDCVKILKKQSMSKTLHASGVVELNLIHPGRIVSLKSSGIIEGSSNDS